jgi:hypothetical protein
MILASGGNRHAGKVPGKKIPGKISTYMPVACRGIQDLPSGLLSTYQLGGPGLPGGKGFTNILKCGII